MLQLCFEFDFFYSHAAAVECIHAETYARLLEIVVPDNDDRERLLDINTTFPGVRKKIDYIQRYVDNCDKEGFATRLVAMTFTEGLFFSSSFN
mgnify:CR=1 FL=1